MGEEKTIAPGVKLLTLTTHEAAEILRQYFKLPETAEVDFYCGPPEFLDEVQIIREVPRD